MIEVDIMHLAEIDYMANNGNSILHRARVTSKFIFTINILISIILLREISTLAVLVGLVFTLFYFAKVNLKGVCHLAMYPVFFSMLFALIIAQKSLLMGGIVILKATGAALAMILLITTTPYVEVFAFLSLFLPQLLIDIFFATYRSFFILLDRIETLIKSIRLRGGYHPFKFLLNFKNIALLVANLIIYAFEMSERMHQIYLLRGYDGKIHITRNFRELQFIDILIIIISFVILFGAVFLWML